MSLKVKALMTDGYICEHNDHCDCSLLSLLSDLPVRSSSSKLWPCKKPWRLVAIDKPQWIGCKWKVVHPASAESGESTKHWSLPMPKCKPLKIVFKYVLSRISSGNLLCSCKFGILCSTSLFFGGTLNAFEYFGTHQGKLAMTFLKFCAQKHFAIVIPLKN